MNFLPHGYCIQWDPWIIWMMLMGNLGVSAAYFLIPVFLYQSRKVVERASRVAWKGVCLYGAFILFCGIGHAVKMMTFWKPWYFFEATWDLLTAAVSIWAAIYTKRVALPALSQMWDRSERTRAAENAARTEQDRLSAFFIQAPLMVVMCLSDGEVVQSSAEWNIHFCPSRRDPCTGRTIYAIIPDFPAKWEKANEQAVHGNQRIVLGREVIQLPSGLRPVEYTVAPWKSQGITYGFIAFIQFRSEPVRT